MNEKKRFYVYWSLVFAAAMLCVFLLAPQSHAETAAKNEAASGSLIDAIRSSIPEAMKEEAREVHEAGREAKDEKERAEALKKAQNDLPRLDALLAALYKCELLPDAAKNMIRDAVSKVRSLQQNLWEQNQSIIHYLYAMGNVLGEMLGATIEGEANVTIAALSEDPAAQKLFFELLLEYEERPAAFGPEPAPEEDRAGVLKRAEEHLEMFDMLLNALYESDQLEHPLKDAIRLGVSKIRGSSLNLWDQNDLVISLLINMGEILRKRSNAEENVLYAALAKVPASQMLMRTLEKSYSKRPEVLGPKPDFDFDAEPEDGEGGDDFHALCRTGSADKVKAAIAAGAGREAKDEKERADLLKKAQDDLPKIDALLAAVYESDKLDKNFKEMIREEVIRERSSWRNVWDQNRHIVRYVYKMGELVGAKEKDGEKSMFAALSEDLKAQKTFLLLSLAYKERPAALGPDPWSTRAGLLEIAEDDVQFFKNVLDALYASDQLEKSAKDIIRSRVSEVRASARNLWDQNRSILSYLLILGEGLRDESKAEENVVMAVVSKHPIAEYAMHTLLQRYSAERPEVLGPEFSEEQGSADQPHNDK